MISATQSWKKWALLLKSKSLFAGCFLLLGLHLNGNAQKVGFVNADILLWFSPGYLAINDSLERMQQQLQEKLITKQNYGKTLLEQYYLNEKNLTPEQRNRAEKQINDIKNEIDNYLYSAEVQIEITRLKMEKPYKDRIDSVATRVAEEGNYRYILNHSNQNAVSNILYGPESDNLMAIFAEKLGIILPFDYLETYREGQKQLSESFQRP
jgi:Skp family chaperone for outer membrane proteins